MATGTIGTMDFKEDIVDTASLDELIQSVRKADKLIEKARTNFKKLEKDKRKQRVDAEKRKFSASKRIAMQQDIKNIKLLTQFLAKDIKNETPADRARLKRAYEPLVVEEEEEEMTVADPPRTSVRMGTASPDITDLCRRK